MLAYYLYTVYCHHLPVGESLCDDFHGTAVVVGLAVCGHKHRTVDNEEVGIGGRQPLAIDYYRRRHWQAQQTVGLAALSAQRFQLFLHGVQLYILLVTLIITPYI